jgi:hypothetical protein
MDPLNCIELTLKTPNQRFNDIRLKCDEDWTIKKLKEHLQDVYPSKPVRIKLFRIYEKVIPNTGFKAKLENLEKEIISKKSQRKPRKVKKLSVYHITYFTIQLLFPHQVC